MAFLFVTLPFVVRTVQPVLDELDPEVEEASASLGASRFTTFRRVILPSLIPAIAAGAALSFARAVSEYGSLVLLSGNLPFRTEVTSVRILSSIENNNTESAAAVATVLLVISLAVIVDPRPRPAEDGAPWLTRPTRTTPSATSTASTAPRAWCSPGPSSSRAAGRRARGGA